MIKWSLDLLTMCDIFVAAILLIIFMQMNVQAFRYRERIDLVATNGSFSSPNYPGQYPGGITYEWIMPMTSKELQIEFVELDLYNCYVQERNQRCESFDYVYIPSHSISSYYCNWNRLIKPIRFPPWTRASIILYSRQSEWRCRGRGFKAEYKPAETTTTTTKTTLSFTTRSKSTDAISNGDQSVNFSGDVFLLLLLLVIPLILILVCSYWCCCRTSRPRVSENQEILQTTLDNWNNQSNRPVVPHSSRYQVRNTHQDGTFLTVDLPPLHRTGSSDGITQTRQQSNLPVSYSDERQSNDNELRETVAQDPPPSYDEVWENSNLSRSQSFRFLPSYEAVIRGSTLTPAIVDQGTDNVDDTELHYNYDIQRNVRTLNLESNTSNEANAELRIFETTI